MRSDDEAPPPGPSTRAVSSPAIPPANGEIARRVRRTLPLTVGAGIDDVLDTHAKLLDALFTELLVNDATGGICPEREGLKLALRAQQQHRQTLQAKAALRKRKPKW